MVIKSIYFDLDGVLVDSRELHYLALNKALEEVDEKYIISREQHLSTFDGLSTKDKLNILTTTRNLSPDLHNIIWNNKQKWTNQFIDTFSEDTRIVSILKTLKNMGYTLYVASNCIYSTIKLMLLRKGFLPFIDYFISNEDVSCCKPSPEIYLKCIIRNKINPSEALIIEDSHIGRQSALNSGCHLLPVENTNDITLDKILNRINEITNKPLNIKWKGKLNIVIPCAGAGSRFEKVGYTFPKPLIDVNGKPMIQVVVENLNCDPENCQFIYIVQKSHYEKYNMKYLLNLLTPNCKIVQIDGITQGAVCSVLLAKEYFNNDDHLLLANSDQYLEWNSNEFLYSMIADDIDAGISTFESTHPKWSFAKLDDNGFVCEVAEKKPISNIATTGIYYWKHGRDFVKYAEQMIQKDIRVNNEFYVCPVFNEAILDNKKIKVKGCKKMWGIGVPEDLNYFLEHFSRK